MKRSIISNATAVLAALAVAGLVAASGKAQRSVIIVPDPSDAPEEAPAPPAAAGMSLARLERVNATVKVENPAGVAVDLISGLEVAAGAKIGLRVAAKKPGYLVLVGVDPGGKLTQIFPDPAAAARGLREAANVIRPGHPLTLPQAGTPGFQFVADRAAGVAVVIALLSDKPVQVVDLPDTPPPGFAPEETLKYVRDQVRTLKVPNPATGDLAQPTWSIDGRFYLIQ